MASGRREIDPRGTSTFDAIGRKRIDSSLFIPDTRLAVLFAFGQSNIANEGAENGLHVPEAGVYNFNVFDGECYVARDPLLGASGSRSNFLTRLGDLLVRRGVYDRVLLVPIGCGNTYIADWAPGGSMYPRIETALARVSRAEITITHALWQQGEGEANQPDPDGAVWVQCFNAMVAAIRGCGMNAPIQVALCTLCRNQPCEIIRAAQREVVNSANGIFAGPDTDTIGTEDRWDGCHFSVTGLDKAAELWFRALTGKSP